MIGSAKQTPAEQRLADRRYEIQRTACRLVIEHGYDGFTMDGLADAVGVSRRTLFNTVHDKESAVLGPDEFEKHPAITEFRQASPSADPFTDLTTFARSLMEEAGEPQALDCHELVEEAMGVDPKVLQLVNDRFAVVTEYAATAICDRQNWEPGDRRARVLATTLLALIQLSLDRFATDQRPIGEVFQEDVDAFRSAVGLD